MICNLCDQDSRRIIRVNSWQVCQWCVTHNVLEHALGVECDIARLREAVAKSGAAYQQDVMNEDNAEANLERAYAAYADLTTAMDELTKCKAASKESLRIERAAKKALQDYKHHDEKTRKARRQQAQA